MNWFKNLKTGIKLLLAFSVLAVLVCLIGVMGTANMRKLDERIDYFHHDLLQPSIWLGSVNAVFEHSRYVQLTTVRNWGNAAALKGEYERWDNNMAKIDKILAAVSAVKWQEEQLPLVKTIEENSKEFRASQDRMLAILRDETRPLAEKQEAAFNFLVDEKNRVVGREMRLAFEKLAELQEKGGQKIFQDSVANYERQRKVFIALIGLGALLAVLMGFGLTRHITRPLGDVEKALAKVAAGNLDIPELNTRRTDEMGSLAKSLQRTVDILRNMIGGLKQASTQVASSADEISASSVQINKGAESQSAATDETSSTMVEMASQIDNVSKSAQNLASNVDQTSSSIQEMGASIEQVARNAESLLSSVEETSSTIEQMTVSIRAIAEKTKFVDDVSRESAKIASSSGDELSRVISGIGARSKDIGKIVKIIEEIADQTNLLALNAAIEAARAGDAGKGFAVVAEEVKRLAERSMNSTREISTFIEAVQKDTNQAVDLTGGVLKQIIDSVGKTSSLVSEVFNATQEQNAGASAILKTAVNMQHIAQEMAVAAKEQANTSREINKAVETMNRMTQQVADATVEQKKGGDMVVKAVEQIATVSQQNLSATEQLSRATISLAKEAERMQSLTEQFVVA